MNITLVGMSGVGKSSVGRLLGKRLGYRFIDIDRLIEQANGKKLQDIVDCLGDEKFLELEENAILGIGDVSDSVISPGGSSIYSERVMAFLKSISKVVFLEASLEAIRGRSVEFSVRGVVGLRERGLEALFLERQPLYRRYADVTVDVTRLSKAAVVERIIECLK